MSAPKQPPVEPLYMSVAQYAAHLAVSTRTVKRRIAANHIPSLHIGRRRLIPWRQADRVLTERLVREEREVHRNPLRKSLQPAPAPPEVPLSRLSEIAFRSGDFIVRDRGHEGTHDAV
jgi:excisionase family DNA binding protein